MLSRIILEVYVNGFYNNFTVYCTRVLLYLLLFIVLYSGYSGWRRGIYAYTDANGYTEGYYSGSDGYYSGAYTYTYGYKCT